MRLFSDGAKQKSGTPKNDAPWSIFSLDSLPERLLEDLTILDTQEYLQIESKTQVGVF